MRLSRVAKAMETIITKLVAAGLEEKVAVKAADHAVAWAFTKSSLTPVKRMERLARAAVLRFGLVGGAFSWEDTPEGHDYWDNIDLAVSSSHVDSL